VQNLVRNNKLKKWFLSSSRLPAVDIGTNVVVRVPDLDRGCLAPRNVLAVKYIGKWVCTSNTTIFIEVY